MTVRNTYLFANGMVATFDEDGQQVPALQGRVTPELGRAIRRESTPATEWHGWGEDGPINRHLGPSYGNIKVWTPGPDLPDGPLLPLKPWIITECLNDRLSVVVVHPGRVLLLDGSPPPGATG